ncbi:hypothetical protein ASE02_08100 [Phenylobacterium sp. Root700]|nr:hypothetical protein ASE02_08100 [Phenylobacterium sp. Root700]
MTKIPTWALWVIVITSGLFLAARSLRTLVFGQPFTPADAILDVFGLLVFAPQLYARLRSKK